MLDIFVSLSGVLLYHYILLLIILQDLASVEICCAYLMILCLCLCSSQICHCIYNCLFILATVPLILQADSFILGDNRL